MAKQCQVIVKNKMNDGTEMENAVREVLAVPMGGRTDESATQQVFSRSSEASRTIGCDTTDKRNLEAGPSRHFDNGPLKGRRSTTGTRVRYRVYHVFLLAFEQQHGVSVLVPSSLSAPPTEPEMASAYDLPAGTGAVQCNLLPETKTNRTSVMDVVMTYTSSAGLSVGKWLHRLRAFMCLDEFAMAPTPVFVHEDGRLWTFHYFRTHYLIPLLDVQRRQGDSFLAPYDESKPGKSLGDVFYYMHSFSTRGL
jgi:hypothetical protein